MADGEAIHGDIQKLAGELTLVGGRVVMSPEVFAAWEQRLDAAPAKERDSLLLGLVALATRFHREADEATAQARTQLMQLAAVLLTPADAEALFLQMGLVDKNRTGVVTGADHVSNRPVAKAAAGKGVMGLQMENKRKR